LSFKECLTPFTLVLGKDGLGLFVEGFFVTADFVIPFVWDLDFITGKHIVIHIMYFSGSVKRIFGFYFLAD